MGSPACCRHARRHSMARSHLRLLSLLLTDRENLCEIRFSPAIREMAALQPTWWRTPPSPSRSLASTIRRRGATDVRRMIGWRSLRMAGDGRGSASMASAPPRISSPRSADGRVATSTPSRAPAMNPRRLWPCRLARVGPAARTRLRPNRSMPRLYSRRSERWFRTRSRRSQRRPRRLRRHPHERHSAIPLLAPVGGTSGCICRQSDAARCQRISAIAPQAGTRRQPLSIRWRAQTKRLPISGPVVSRARPCWSPNQNRKTKG